MTKSRAFRVAACAGAALLITQSARGEPVVRSSSGPELNQRTPLRNAAEAQGLENFTFQGRLDRDTYPFTGAAAVRLRVYDSAFGGTILTGIEYPPLAIVEGLVNLDVPYDPAIFDGSPRWLEVAVRDQYGTSWEILGDRMPIKATPSAQVAQQSRGLVLPATVASTEEGMGLLSVDNTSTTGFALLGTNNFSGTAGALGFPDAGVLGETLTAGVQGVRGQHFGVGDDTPGVSGTHIDTGFGIGVEGKGGYAGVQGVVEFSQEAEANGVVGGTYGYGAGIYSGVTGIGQTLNGAGISIGVQGLAESTGGDSFAIGVYGAQGQSAADWAGYFDGDLYVGGQTYAAQIQGGGDAGAISAGTPIAMAPLAAVSIDATGEVRSAAGCVLGVTSLGSGRYRIDLAGGLDSSGDISVSATPVGAFAIPVVTPMDGSSVLISLHGADGSPVEAGVQLTVHDARPGRSGAVVPVPTLRTLPTPTGEQDPGSPALPRIDGDKLVPRAAEGR